MTGRVVVAGGSIAGLAAALALSGRGVPTLVLDRSTADGPALPQAGHSHTFTSLGLAVLRDRAPEVLAALLAAGATPLDVGPGPDLVALGCRRTVLQDVLRRVVAAAPGVELRRGIRVTGLQAAGGRVTGVVLADGTAVPAELVLDATGRRSCSAGWLADLGVATAADRWSPTRLRAFSRFYRRAGALGPLNRGNAAGVVGEQFAGVVHPADGEVFSIALGTLPDDRALDPLREPAGFDAAARYTPWVADWMPDAEPLTGVRVLTCPPNVLRGAALAPYPGLLPVGDAACVTDPIFGRGMSLALAHAYAVVDAVLDGGDPAAITQDLLAPWYEQATVDSVDRTACWQAAVAGEPAPEPPPGSLRAVGRAVLCDPAIGLAVTRVLMGLTPPERAYAGLRIPAGGPTAPGPTRAELLGSLYARR
jgi:2-polyprenyl-6-methoxyphenol hydroxylase-like FAD-dependent oxidoreductase